MKETKKMLAIIEKQYIEANLQYKKQQQEKFKKECRKEFILGASLFLNIALILTIIASIGG